MTRSCIFSTYSLEDQVSLRLLLRRFHGAKFRTSLKAKRADRRTYRGISFDFESPCAAAEWAFTNLGPMPSGKQLDRIDSRGNYAVHNLRYASCAAQLSNRIFKRSVRISHAAQNPA